MFPEMRAPTTDLIRMKVKGKVEEPNRTECLLNRTDCLISTMAMDRDNDLSGRIDSGMT